MLALRDGEWAALILVFMPLWLPVLILLILPRVLRWDDARRQRMKNRPGFPVRNQDDEQSKESQ